MRRDPSRSTVPRAALLVAACLTALLASPARPAAGAAGRDEPALNLFQRIARADLVVHVKVREGALKYARVEVIEALKGEPPAKELRIAFRDYNFDRPPGTEPIVLTDGREEILLLAPYGRVGRKPRNLDLYEILRGPEGRITVPPEGARALLDAFRRLATITRLDPAGQIEALRDLLASDNPDLTIASLEEILRLRALTTGQFPRLITLARGPSPTLRSFALRGMARLFSGPRDGGGPGDSGLEEARAALAAALERARNDTEEGVRVEAVAAIAAWPVRGQVEGELRAIADQDPAQAVRYEAERALFRPHP